MFSSPRLQHGCENLVCMHEHCVSAYGQTCCNLTCKISFPQRCLRTGGGGGGGHHGLYSPGGGGFGGRWMPGAIHLPPSSQATLAAGVADWLLHRKLKYHTKLLCQLSPPLLLHRSCFRRAATGLRTVKIPRKSYMCCLNPAWKFATASKPANFVFSSFFRPYFRSSGDPGCRPAAWALKFFRASMAPSKPPVSPKRSGRGRTLSWEAPTCFEPVTGLLKIVSCLPRSSCLCRLFSWHFRA